MSFGAPGLLGGSPTSSGYTTPLLGSRRGASLPPDSYLPTRVLDSKRRHKLALDRLNLRGLHLPAYLFQDFYHTLVNCRWHRFYLLFVLIYFGMYSAFAAFYVSQPPSCVSNLQNFWHALWFSVHTSATIGYGAQAPNPDCYLLQLAIMAQVLVSLFMQGSLLGLVYARISSSSGRSATIRFSKALSICCGEDGLYRLTFRVANLRQHQVLQPEARMLLLRRQATHPFSSGATWEYLYSELAVQHVGGGKLWLGVPSLIEHVVDHMSPLYGKSEAEIRESDMEFIVLLDGIDEATSRAIEARHSYVPSEIRWQHRFDSCLQRSRSGKLGIDFSRFDTTAAPSSGSGGLAASANGLRSFPSDTSGRLAAAAAAAAAVSPQQAQQQRRGPSSLGHSKTAAVAATPSPLSPGSSQTKAADGSNGVVPAMNNLVAAGHAGNDTMPS